MNSRWSNPGEQAAGLRADIIVFKKIKRHPKTLNIEEIVDGIM